MPILLPRTTSARALGEWTASAAHVRAVILSAGAAVAAVVGSRPDLLVIAAPLVVAAIWGQVSRPRGEAVAEVTLSNGTLREGDIASLVVRVGQTPGVDGIMTLASSRWVERKPRSGVAPIEDGVGSLALRTTRWGRRQVGTVSVSL